MDYIPTGGTRESQMSVENAVCSFFIDFRDVNYYDY